MATYKVRPAFFPISFYLKLAGRKPRGDGLIISNPFFGIKMFNMKMDFYEGIVDLNAMYSDNAHILMKTILLSIEQ